MTIEIDLSETKLRDLTVSDVGDSYALELSLDGSVQDVDIDELQESYGRDGLQPKMIRLETTTDDDSRRDEKQ